MNYLRLSTIVLLLTILSTNSGCLLIALLADVTDEDYNEVLTLHGTWILIAATANGDSIPNASMTLNLFDSSHNDCDSFAISSVTVETFNGFNNGYYCLYPANSNATAMSFLTNNEVNTASIMESPITGQEQLALSFTTNLAQHGDSSSTSYVYRFEH